MVQQIRLGRPGVWLIKWKHCNVEQNDITKFSPSTVDGVSYLTEGMNIKIVCFRKLVWCHL